MLINALFAIILLILSQNFVDSSSLLYRVARWKYQDKARLEDSIKLNKIELKNVLETNRYEYGECDRLCNQLKSLHFIQFKEVVGNHCLKGRWLKSDALQAFQQCLNSTIIPDNLKSIAEGYVIELQTDIDDYVSRLEIEDVEIPRNSWFSSRMKRRIKMVISQLILFGINMIQTELNAQLARRAADKRLAEIPEFPNL